MPTSNIYIYTYKPALTRHLHSNGRARVKLREYIYIFWLCSPYRCISLLKARPFLWRWRGSTSVLTKYATYQIVLPTVATGAKHFLGGGAQTNWMYGRSGPSSLIFFFLHPNALWMGIFVKIKPNFLSSRDIVLASTLISTCLPTDELLLSGMRVIENGPITWGQTYKNNIDSL